MEDVEHGQIFEYLTGVGVEAGVAGVKAGQERSHLVGGTGDGLVELLGGFATALGSIDELAQRRHDGDPTGKHLVLLAELTGEDALAAVDTQVDGLALPHVEGIELALGADEDDLTEDAEGIVDSELEGVILGLQNVGKHLVEVAVVGGADIDFLG